MFVRSIGEKDNVQGMLVVSDKNLLYNDFVHIIKSHIRRLVCITAFKCVTNKKPFYSEVAGCWESVLRLVQVSVRYVAGSPWSHSLNYAFNITGSVA